MKLTFLNLTDAPGLRRSDLKTVRGHVTKVNFKKRSQRLKMANEQGNRSRSNKSPSIILKNGEKDAINPDVVDAIRKPRMDLLSIQSPPEPDHQIRYLLTEFRPIVFPAPRGHFDRPSEESWVALLQSEEALVEASMAIAARHSARRPHQANSHVYRAVHIISQRLNSKPVKLTDGLLGAVFTLSYSELLVKDQSARDAHIEGLAQMIRLRRSQGYDDLPQWFTQFLVHDSIGSVISSPHKYSTTICDALDDPVSREYINGVARVAIELAGLSQLCEHASLPTRPSLAFETIQSHASTVNDSIAILPASTSSYMQAFVAALELYLAMLWPTESSINLQPSKADELRRSLGEPKIRLCSGVHVMAWQLLIGAAAAEPGTATRSWFLLRLRRILRVMQISSWESLISLLQKTFIPTSVVLTRFRQIWDEAIRMTG